MTELCRAAKAQGGFTVWINRDAPPSGLKFPLDLTGIAMKSRLYFRVESLYNTFN